MGVLHGVVPGGLVARCRSLDRTSISRMLVSHLYAWLIEDLSHLSTYLKTPVGEKDSARTINGRVVKETDDGSLFSSCVIVSNISENIEVMAFKLGLKVDLCM